MADIVGQDHVVFCNVERLAGAIKLISELWLEELLARAARAVKDHHRIVDLALFVPVRGAESRIMHPHFRELLARAEGEILEDHIAVLKWPGLGKGRGCEKGEGRDQRGQDGAHKGMLGRHAKASSERRSFPPFAIPDFAVLPDGADQNRAISDFGALFYDRQNILLNITQQYFPPNAQIIRQPYPHTVTSDKRQASFSISQWRKLISAGRDL